MRFLFILIVGALPTLAYASDNCHDSIQAMLKLEYTLVGLDTRVAADHARGEKLMPDVLALASQINRAELDEDCQINTFREFVSLAFAAAPFEIEDHLAGIVVAATAVNPVFKTYVNAIARSFYSTYADRATASCRVPLLESRVVAQICNLSGPQRNSCFDHPFDFNKCLLQKNSRS